jgi:hypothetical protein
MSHVYVIAGTFEQARQYISKKRSDYLLSGDPPLLMPNYLAVTEVRHLKGISRPHGVFIGTWRDRLDIYDIVQTLALAWNGEHQMLNRMTLNIPLPRKPTPKLKPDDVVQAAAELLAKEIDAHVLKTAMKDLKQWTMLPLKP